VKIFGLIGYPLGHSFSKKYFTEKFEIEKIANCKYELFPIEKISLLESLLESNKDINGLNVTIPYKEQVLPFLNELDETANAIGAVNCIQVSHQNNGYSLKGYNTDAYGFEISIKPLIKEFHNKALILGTGGASKAVEYIVKKLGIETKYVSRTARENIFGYEEIDKKVMEEYTVIVNTSPLGMYPNTDQAPALPYQFVSDKHLLYDLVYNPETTQFMKYGLKQGATVKNGLEMLHGQAEKAWEIWNKDSS